MYFIVTGLMINFEGIYFATGLDPFDGGKFFENLLLEDLPF